MVVTHLERHVAMIIELGAAGVGLTTDQADHGSGRPRIRPKARDQESLGAPMP